MKITKGVLFVAPKRLFIKSVIRVSECNERIWNLGVIFVILLKLLLISGGIFDIPSVFAVTTTPTISATASPSAHVSAKPTIVAEERPDLTQKSEKTIEPLEKLLDGQSVESVFPFNFIKIAIRKSVEAGVPVNTLVLILLLPLIATVIAATRQLIGLRGFGIFLPASLAVVFVATGPAVGIFLFLMIVAISTATRMALRRFKIKLQYLPRMALILWTVSVGVLSILFLTPVFRFPGLTNVSNFAVLILALLTEDFIRIQLGKSVKTAVRLTSETIILSIISYLFMTYTPVQEYALLHPEAFLLIILIVDVVMGRYAGLREMELWRFRKLIQNR